MIRLQVVLSQDATSHLISVVSRHNSTLSIAYNLTVPVRLEVQYEDGRKVDLRGSSTSLSIREPSRGGMRQVVLAMSEGQDAADGVLTGTLTLPASLYPGEYHYEVAGTVSGYLVYFVPLSSFLILRTGASP